MDYTTVHPASATMAHLIDLHLWRGAPKNVDKSRPIQILVNHGFVVGFSADRLQPAWSAYRVAHAEADVDYDRPLSYYDDLRLSPEERIGRRTFGKIGNVQLNVGHMSPNEVINRQFGRLAQLETFLMSNMSPQYGSLNSGVWLKLETAIREIKDEKGKDHVWVIVGPVFGKEPRSIYRGPGKSLPIPKQYFCVTVDPFRYPYDTPSRVKIDCFMIPQNASKRKSPKQYPATLEEIEEATNLRFFDGWGRDIPQGFLASMDQEGESDSRLMKILDAHYAEEQAEAKAQEDALAAEVDAVDSIEGLIEALRSEAAQIQVQGRALTDEEVQRLATIQHTISWLIRARDISCEAEEDDVDDTTLITYKIVDDVDGKLQRGARTACNFWNRFVEPKQSIVIRLGTFTQLGRTIARAYVPYSDGDTVFGRVEFNTKYLSTFGDDETAGTIVHEIGHTLGIGWEKWQKLYDKETGRFTSKAVSKLSALRGMEVELDYGPGTEFAHWDEGKFDKELMTGIQDYGEHVLPVTIDLMKLFGHKVIEELSEQTPLSDLLHDAACTVFSRQDEARVLNLDYFEETELLETIPHRPE